MRSNSNMQSSSILGTKSKYEVGYDDLKFDNEVGHGSFGIVYRGELRGSVVAIKVMKGLGTKETDDFVSEIKVMLSLPLNTNVVQLIGVCTDPSRSLCIITEFLDMGSLYNYLNKNEIPDILLASMCSGIAGGIVHLHKNKVVHRDLASRNILLSTELIPKVSDFGLSRVTQNEQGNQTQTDTGPLKWMAPECIIKRNYSTKSDVWSFGVLMIECITREEPFPEIEPVAAATQICMGSLMPEIPIQLMENNNLYQDLGNTVKWCCQVDISARPNMVEVYTHLCEIRKQYCGY